QCVQYSA
ncbi:putative aspartokinase, partial [Vibrio parahaemolyticus AQ3810]